MLGMLGRRLAGHDEAPARIGSNDRPGSRPDDGALVVAHGVGVARDGRWLVRDVNLAVRPREIVTVIGPNGSGKTTIARALLGLETPDAGWVERSRGLAVGYVPQRLALDRTMPLTVRRLMTLTGRYHPDAAEEALARVGVAHLADAEPQTLSGGEFQRVLLARALIRRPQLLVLDEPVQGVDFRGEIALYDLIGRIRDELGCGILLISHDLHIVMAKTDIVVCLNTHVCCQGPPQAVAESPEYRRLFGHRAAGTLAVYRHVHDADGHAHDESRGDPDHSGSNHHGQGQCGHAHPASPGPGSDPGHRGTDKGQRDAG